ncbi:MAG: serine protease Do [Halioglobus sp.]|jgi:serine protease Do
MRMVLRAHGIIVLLLFGCAQSVWSVELADLIDQVRPSVVGIGTAYPPRQPQRGQDRVAYAATGFVVGDGLHVITNAHAIPSELDRENNQNLAVFTGNGAGAKIYIAREVRRDADHDLVLLEIRGTPLPALPIGNSDAVREGQAVAFTGFPIGLVLGLYPATHRGIIAAITPMAQPVSDAGSLSSAQVRSMRKRYMAFQLDATAYPGNSGSPMFELETGQVIGVINSVLVKESKETLLSRPSGISYAIPSKYVEQLLAPKQ